MIFSFKALLTNKQTKISVSHQTAQLCTVNARFGFFFVCVCYFKWLFIRRHIVNSIKSSQDVG